jgi:hypothetical protein
MTVTDEANVNIGGDGLIQLGRLPGSTGSLTISDGGVVEVGDTKGYVTVGGAYIDLGLPIGGSGVLTVTGTDSRLSVVTDLEIGAPLTYGGGLGNGLVVVRDGGLIEADRVLIGLGGTLTGNGGTVAADVHLDGGTLAPGNTPGTMQIDGDYLMTDGELVIEVAGLAAGQFDVVEITGSADLLGGTILFQFIDGFLPSAGDMIEFLTAAGPIAVDAVNFAFAGLAAGFLFDVDFSTEGLLLTALNDGLTVAVPEPASFLLFLSGLGLVVAIAQRRRRPCLAPTA